MAHRKVNTTSSGFTLLEVMLSLSLASLLLVAIGSAIDIHLRLLDSGRTKVEEAQLARSLLSRMADDLRCAVPFDPKDGQQAESSTSEPTDGESADGSSGMSGEETGTGDDLSDSSASASIGNLADSYVPQSVPGLFGNSAQLQVDVHRMPRIDRLAAAAASTDPAAMSADQSAGDLCDVTTVTYYMSDDEMDSPAPEQDGGDTGSGDQPNGNSLVRREQGRATAVWSGGGLTAADSSSSTEVLASEIAAIQFTYCDGTEWYDTWDSIEMGALPAAVQITVAVVPTRLRGKSLDSLDDAGLLLYSLTVRLPMTKSPGEGGL